MVKRLLFCVSKRFQCGLFRDCVYSLKSCEIIYIQVRSFDSSIPASTSIHLPRVDISGALDTSGNVMSVPGKRHLKIVADIGTLNQNLSTDLLNHLIFIQKGFMKVFSLKYISTSASKIYQ